MIQVKICFVMDCTASMGPWIRDAKTKMVDLMNGVRNENPNTDIQVGFVGYRDYGDEERMIVLPFQNAKDTMAQIQGVQAKGGDDEAEDVGGGLHCAFHMDWIGADVKIVFHIADAPAHGNTFHRRRVSDRYPRGDPHGLDPRDSVERMSFLDIDYTFVRIDESTDVMVELFRNCYVQGGTFSVIDLRSHCSSREDMEEDPQPLYNELSRVITQSITNYTISQEL
jgi:hypothetical protein